MAQIYYNLFFIYVLPVFLGFLLGICLWKLRKTYILSALLLFASMVWWCILPHINTHGSEGPGLLALMFSLMTISFTCIEIIKFTARK